MPIENVDSKTQTENADRTILSMNVKDSSLKFSYYINQLFLKFLA